MTEKTILILTSNFPPTNIVGALRPFRLTNFLRKNGWGIVVLTHPPRAEQSLDASLLEEMRGPVEIHRLSAPRRERQGESRPLLRLEGACRDLLGRCVRPDLDIVHVPRFYRAARQIMATRRIDVVLTTSPPHSIHLAGLMLKRGARTPWVADFRDPWDDYVRKGDYGLSNPLERYLERQVVRHCDAVITTTETNLRVLREKHRDQDGGKMHVVTNTYSKGKTSRPVQKDPHHFVICYTGIFYPDKDPYGFFRVLR